MKSEDIIKSLIDDSQWIGGWYQDIILPDGSRTISTTLDFDKHESRSLKKWDIIERFMSSGRFLDIGCNAGAYLVKASKRYSELYGIDNSTYFLTQCRFILDQFKVNANLFCCPAMDFDFSQIPYMDTTVMIHSLYWLYYSDEKGYFDRAEARLHEFLDRLKKKTSDLIIIGSEGVDRIGGNLKKTDDFISDHFKVIESGFESFNDRKLNFIYARS